MSKFSFITVGFLLAMMPYFDGGAVDLVSSIDPVVTENYSVVPDAVSVVEPKDSEATSLVMKGMFTNGCYRLGTAEYVIDDNHDILVRNQVKFQVGRPCTMALVPYQQTLQLGKLEPGSYQVFIEDKEGHLNLSLEFDAQQPGGNHDD